MNSRGCRRGGPVASRAPARRPRSATRRPACPGASGVRPVPCDPRHGPPTAGSPRRRHPAAPPKSRVPPRTAADGPRPRIRAGAASEETAEPRARRRVPPDTTCRAGQGLQCGSHVDPGQGNAMIRRVTRERRPPTGSGRRQHRIRARGWERRLPTASPRQEKPRPCSQRTVSSSVTRPSRGSWPNSRVALAELKYQ